LSKKTLEAAKKTGNDAIIQVKSNQKLLFEDCKDVACLEKPSQTHESGVEKARGRIEQRAVELFSDFVTTDEKWDGLIQEMIKVDRFRKEFDTKQKTWKDTSETSYYISTTKLTAEEYNLAIRNHWGIENRNHNVRDNALGEDASRIRKSPCVFARLRSFALNILRANGVNNIAIELYKNALNINKVMNYKGVF